MQNSESIQYDIKPEGQMYWTNTRKTCNILYATPLRPKQDGLGTRQTGKDCQDLLIAMEKMENQNGQGAHP